MRGIKATPVLQRLLARIEIDAVQGCWVFQGTTATNGYGTIGAAMPDGTRKTFLTHRVAYEGMVGRIPAGLELDHLCRNRACCNPDHLEPVTRSVNTLRGDSPALARQRRLSRTHCIRGHAFEGENLRFTSDGVRLCVECSRQRGRENDRKRQPRRRKQAS